MQADHVAALLEPLGDLGRWLKSSGTPHAIVGGVAATLQGERRATADIDAVVMIPEDDWSRFIKEGEAFGFSPRRRNALEFAKRSRVLLLAHRSGIEIDISLGILPFEEEMIRRAIRINIGDGEIPLATPEDLIVMKSLAMRPNDITDINGLLAVNEKIDLRRVRRWVRAFAEELDAPEIIDQVETLLTAARKSRPPSKGKRKKK